MKVFFDTNILKLSVRRQYAAIPQETSWGPHIIKWDLEVVIDKPRRPGWLQQEIDALERLAPLVRSGLIEACICSEIVNETLFIPGMWQQNTELGIFEDVEFQDVSEPDFFGSLRIAFGRGFDPKKIREEFLSTTIYPRFNRLKEALGGNKNADAFLIWTAESNQLPYFLTTDRKLINSVRLQRKCIFGTHLLYPTELLALLGIRGRSYAACSRSRRVEPSRQTLWAAYQLFQNKAKFQQEMKCDALSRERDP